MMTCTQCGEDERHCHCRRPIFDGDLEDEADCLRDWRRDASAEAALPLPGLEPGPDTISPLDEPVAGTKPTNQQ